jgi:hypothetical protein
VHLPGSPVAATIPATIAGVLGLLEGFPAARRAVHGLFGESATELVLNTSSIALFTISGSALGLAVAGAEALRLFTQVRTQRESWRNY